MPDNAALGGSMARVEEVSNRPQWPQHYELGESYLQDGRWSRRAVYLNYFLGPLPIVSRLVSYCLI